MTKTEIDTRFRLTFKINNQQYDLKNAVGFKLFTLIGELNKDVIEKIYTEPYNNDTKTMNVGILLKSFGKELGLSQKYMCVKTDMIHTSKETVRFISEQIDKPIDIVVPEMSEPVLKASTILDITLHSPHEALVTYDFAFVIEEDLPLYMEKYPGLLMKKIFVRLKTFLENINENSL
jgi:hypothetical protein